MKVAKGVHELIGSTPIVEITKFSLPRNVRIFAKLEYFNPGGSVKDRLGVELLEAALKSGELIPGGTIIEPTAGNTGIGLALAAINQGIHVIFCVPEKFSMEKQEIMRALGAKIEHPVYMDKSYFNSIHTIFDEEAFHYVKELAAKEGLLVGSSSGSAFAAAIKEAQIATEGTNIVVIFPDSSDRYLSKKIYQGGI